MAEDTRRGLLRRFLLEGHPVRGHHVQLGAAWRELRAVHAYPPAVETLLGEAVTAAVLLAATLKFHGKLTLQFTGHGKVSLLVAQCTHDFRIRAVAQHEDDIPSLADFATLVGDGRLAVTVESSDPTGQYQGGRYQGIVPLNVAGIAPSLEDYFASSEQLPTRLRLMTRANAAAGLLLQRLPAPNVGEAEAAQLQSVWDALGTRLAEFADDELTQPTESLLPRLCQELDSRLFADTGVEFHCGCSKERVSGMLRSLGIEELRDIVREQGGVTVDCEFCRRSYRFDAIDVEGLFAAVTPSGADGRPN